MKKIFPDVCLTPLIMLEILEEVAENWRKKRGMSGGRFPAAVDELEAINNFLLEGGLMSGHKKCYAVLHQAVLRRLNIFFFFFSLLIMTLRHEVFSGQVSQYLILNSTK